jgi:hypothetical protein
MYILIYVDDIIIACSKSSTIDTLLTLLNTDLSIKDLGPLHFFLGIEVINNSAGFLLSQQRYILDILCAHQHGCSQACVFSYVYYYQFICI